MGDLVQMRDFKRREEVKQMSEKARKILDQIHYHDTSPCEMPPVQPIFSAPDRDPA